MEQNLFGGDTYNAARDAARLTGQLGRVEAIMQDGDWHTLAELAERCGGTQTAISARIRDFRKPKFGGREVERAHVERGLWKYRLVPA